MRDLAVYIHIPYCLAKCRYCAFTSGTDFSTVEVYVKCLQSEMTAFFTGQTYQTREDGIFFYGQSEPCHGNKQSNEENIVLGEGKSYSGAKYEPYDYLIRSVYIGGGTPTSISAKYIVEILQTLRLVASVAGDAEISIECNPATLTAEKAKAYVACGINRVSVGLQSANDDTLRRIGRIHSRQDFADTMTLIKQVGIDNVSADIILGLPGEGESEVMRTLDFLDGFELTHISCYGLTVEKGTPLYAEGYCVDEDGAADSYDLVVDRLKSYGFDRYEISNFAKPGRFCRHNLVYWQGGDYRGFGVAAHSLLFDTRYNHSDDVLAYLSNPNSLLVEQRLTVMDREMEFVMLYLRLENGFLRAEYRERFGVDFCEKQAQALVKVGVFMDITIERVRIRPDKLYCLNAILVEFLVK